jgi:DNA-binding NarL/FixJ family response regulator
MTVAVVSPHSITRKALCALLRSIPQVTVVLDVDNALEHFESLQKMHPGVLLFDALNPAADLETVVRTRKVIPEVRILVLAAGVDEEFELRTIRAGARGCVSRGADPQVLAKALAMVERDEVWVSQRIASRIIGEFVRSRDGRGKGSNSAELSRREWEILALVAQGFRNKNIAHHLFVSESTVKTHLYAIYKKLEINSRLEATLYYYQHLKGDADSASPVQAPPLSESSPERRPLPPAGRSPRRVAAS